MKLLIIAAFCSLTLAASGFAQQPGGAGGLKPFKTDRCTFFPDCNYGDCCIEHDREYHRGGSLDERKAADKRLKKCVKSKGKGWQRRLLAHVMYLGVRIGGVHWLPTPFRWGFGNKWPRMRPRDSAPIDRK